MKYMTCLSMNTISLPLLACSATKFWHTCSYRRPGQKKIVKFEHAYHGNTWCTEINQLLVSCWNVKEQSFWCCPMKAHVCLIAIEYWMPVVEKNLKKMLNWDGTQNETGSENGAWLTNSNPELAHSAGGNLSLLLAYLYANPSIRAGPRGTR